MAVTRKKRGIGRVLTTSSAEETVAVAEELSRTFRGDEVVFLIGELGAGKTVFAKGIAAGLGLQDIHQVCSPTFTLMNVYQARVPVYHFDLFRLSKEAEVRELGFEDYIGAGVVIVEWGEKMTFPVQAVVVTIAVEDDHRRKIEIIV